MPSHAAPHCRRLIAAAWLLLIGAAGAAGAVTCSEPIDVNAAVLSNGFGTNPSNTRNSNSSITSRNANELTLVLSHAAVGANERRGAPVVTTQAIFTTTKFTVVAIDRTSGCQYWSYSPFEAAADPRLTGFRSLYFLNERGGRPALLFAGDLNGVMHAIDASSGKQKWKRFVGTDTANHIITGTPVHADGSLFIPVSTLEVIATVFVKGLCCRSHGMVQAVNPYTGEAVWSFHVTPDAQVQRENPSRLGPNGGSVWSSPAVDTERHLLYVGTGQNLTRPGTGTSDAIVALDTGTGALRWVFQSTADDTWNVSCQLPLLWGRGSKCDRPDGGDLDFGASPMLATLPDGRPVVIGGAKNGVVYVLDRESGALVWSRRLGAGGNLGGIHWGMATDGKRIYVGVSDLNSSKLTILDKPGAPATIVLSENGKPGVYALDIASGKVEWEQHPVHQHQGAAVPSIFSAALSVTNDVVFAGSLDGVVHAFRTDDGTSLWARDTRNVEPIADAAGNAVRGGTIDGAGPIVAGTDLIVNSGYSAFGGASQFQAGTGNALFVFRAK
jgi:polyvinyl alcohol dehydrogenase (cytochrome)